MSEAIHYYRRNAPEYPACFRELPFMPDGIYVKGSLPPENCRRVAIVGARTCSGYGRAEAGRFARALAGAGVVIISGMAAGIDSCAHQGALDAGGKTYGVLGCGVDVCYPKSNMSLYRRVLQSGGGLISEFEPGSIPASWHFPVRNRLISALADIVLVIEARRKSGSLITADYALEQGKSVYAIPGRNRDALSEGCNCLLAQGAAVADCPERLLEELGLGEMKEKNHKDPEQILRGAELTIYRAVYKGCYTLDQLLSETALPLPVLMEGILRLEMKEIVSEAVPGTYVCCC